MVNNHLLGNGPRVAMGSLNQQVLVYISFIISVPGSFGIPKKMRILGGEY